MKRATSPSPDAPRLGAAFIAIRIATGTIALALVAVLVLALSFRVDLPGVGASLGPVTAGAPAKQQRLRVDSLDELRRTVFFDPVTRKPAVWYSISAAGGLHLFAQPGQDPDNGEWLKPVTDALVQQLERRLKTLDQERLAEAERRAATARADAEIARARQAPDTRSMSGSQRERLPAQAAAPTTSAPSTAPVTASTALPPASTASSLPRNTPVPPASVARAPSAPDVFESHARTGDDDTRRRDYDTRREFDAAPDYDARRRDSETRSRRAEAERTATYNELVSDARALIDAGRYSEARAKAQRALHVDPRRMAARFLWAEAQTRLDETQPQPFAAQSRPRQLF